MKSCELIVAISTLAYWIAQDRTTLEIRQISNIYRILSQTLDAIANEQTFCKAIIDSQESYDKHNSDCSEDSDDKDDSDNSEDSNCTKACECDCSDDCYEFDDFYDSKDPNCY
jgi:hypothetical protein